MKSAPKETITSAAAKSWTGTASIPKSIRFAARIGSQPKVSKRTTSTPNARAHWSMSASIDPVWVCVRKTLRP